MEGQLNAHGRDRKKVNTEQLRRKQTRKTTSAILKIAELQQLRSRETQAVQIYQQTMSVNAKNARREPFPVCVRHLGN